MMGNAWLLPLFLLISFSLRAVCSNLACLDDHGDAVEWWFVYKVNTHNNGTAFAYFDSTSDAEQLSIVKDQQISDSDCALGRTLSQIWQATDAYNYIAYNDEPPDGSNGDAYGHTKGVFAFDAASDTGFFLVHSWPKFPTFYGSEYNIGSASLDYGQSMLCVSYRSFETMNNLAYNIRFNKPKVYNASNLFAEDEANNFTAILDKQWLSSANTYTFDGIDGQQFTHFAKSQKWNNALYEYLVSPFYQQSFIWETWRRSKEQPSFCNDDYEFEELNVNYVQFADGISWKYTNDHAKAGCSIVEKASDEKLVCVGDINRDYTQYNRSGGTLCFKHDGLWSALSAAYSNHDTC